ncbi:unnamed protein product [Sphagnum tenellum]
MRKILSLKNVLIVTDVAAPQVNGVRRTLENTARVLQARGHKVTFIAPPDYRSVPMPFYSEIKLALPPYHLTEERLDAYDAVHIATEGPLGLAARRTVEKYMIQFTTAYHTNFPAYMQKMWKVPERYSYKYLRWFHEPSDAMMVPTRSMLSLLETKGFVNAVHWGRGVDQTLFKPRKVVDIHIGPRPYFLNVGRVSEEKNLPDFLKLDLPGTKIVIGSASSLKTLKKLQKAYPKTVFLGGMTGLPLAEWYNRADVFVFPSISDTYGLVNAEAISSGLPVAAYPVIGPIDIVQHGVTGFLDNDLAVAAKSALTLGSVHGEFSWEIATDQFFNNLSFR